MVKSKEKPKFQDHESGEVISLKALKTSGFYFLGKDNDGRDIWTLKAKRGFIYAISPDSDMAVRVEAIKPGCGEVKASQGPEASKEPERKRAMVRTADFSIGRRRKQYPPSSSRKTLR